MKQDNKEKIQDSFLVDCLVIIAGTFLMAASIHIFISPSNIAPGGATGIAIILNYLTKIPIGVATLLINIPLLILAYIRLGKRFAIQTTISSVAFTFFLDVVLKPVPTYTEDVLLAMIYGGVLTGVGAGLIFLRNGSSGGSDIIAMLFKKHKPHAKTGQLVLLVDGVIILIAVWVFKNVNMAMYAILYKYISAFIIDKVIYGINEGKMVLINSVNNADEIRNYITNDLSKGVTILKSSGGYTDHSRDVLLCAVGKRAFIKLRHDILRIDPNAFIIVTETSEVIGNGFKIE